MKSVWSCCLRFTDFSVRDADYIARFKQLGQLIGKISLFNIHVLTTQRAQDHLINVYAVLQWSTA